MLAANIGQDGGGHLRGTNSDSGNKQVSSSPSYRPSREFGLVECLTIQREAADQQCLLRGLMRLDGPKLHTRGRENVSPVLRGITQSITL